VTGGGTDLLVALFRTLGLDVIQAVLVQSLLSDPLDKVISFTVVLLILGAMPITLRTMYSRGGSTVPAVPSSEDAAAGD
jgi:energy-coupling factor transport system substrate-specific component